MRDQIGLNELRIGLHALAAAPSLYNEERACLLFARAELAARGEVCQYLDVLWTGWAGRTRSWFLRPLRWLFTATSRLSRGRERRGVAAFSLALVESRRDSDFADFWCVPVVMVDPVVEHMCRGGADPEEVLVHEPSSAVLQLETFAELGPEIQWGVTVRYWADCPPDLAAALDFFGDDDGTGAPGKITGGPTRS